MDAQSRSITPVTQSLALPRTQAVTAGAVALILGLFLLYGVGFAQPEAIHNAAHDSRHGFTFPCH